MHGFNGFVFHLAHLFGIAFACNVRGLVFTRAEDLDLDAHVLEGFLVGLVDGDHTDGTHDSRGAGKDVVGLGAGVVSAGGHQLAGIGHRRQRDAGNLVGEFGRTDHRATGRINLKGDALDGRVSEHLVDSVADVAHVRSSGHLVEFR